MLFRSVLMHFNIKVIKTTYKLSNSLKMRLNNMEIYKYDFCIVDIVKISS